MSKPDPNRLPDPRPDRRQFFLRGLREALASLLSVVEGRSGLSQLNPMSTAGPLASPRSVLRPAGAVPEGEFLRTCYRCGSCVDACPVHAIKPVPGEDEDLSGTPYLDADLAACDTCGSLPCVHACPSGALAPPG
jgi:ferredoxin-type protein NapG